MKATNRRQSSAGHMVSQPINGSKILEISLWGSVIWGIARALVHFLNFTPYGVRVFSRPFLGMGNEHSATGVAVGFVVLFGFVLAATVLYAFVFSRFKVWWLGIAYGLAILFLYGMFFHMRRWSYNTLSTEVLWFSSLGLFVGMSLTAERFDEE